MQAELQQYIARFRNGTATGKDALDGAVMLAAWAGAAMVGHSFGKRSVFGYKIYR